jgi:hypothetical protein
MPGGSVKKLSADIEASGSSAPTTGRGTASIAAASGPLDVDQRVAGEHVTFEIEANPKGPRAVQIARGRARAQLGGGSLRRLVTLNIDHGAAPASRPSRPPCCATLPTWWW